MSAKDNRLQPYYFFIGEDALKRTVLEDRLRTRIAALGDVDFNCNIFDGSKDSADDILAACETMPFLCDYRYVLVRHAEGLNAAGAKRLAAYLAAPNDTTVLALSTSGFEARSALAKACATAPKGAVVDCSLGDPVNLARSLATGHGATISPAAAAALVELAGTDTIHLDAELEKLALAHVGTEPISVEEVRQLVAPLAAKDFKPWEFLDALSARDAAKCFRILSGVEDGDLIRLLNQCVGRLKELLAAKSASCSTPATLAAALSKKDWQVRNCLKWAGSIPADTLEAAIISAADTDCAMKSGTDNRFAFTKWLCDYFAALVPSARR